MGTIIGLGLAVTLFAAGSAADMVIIGEAFNPTTLAKVVGFFLTIGFCANYGRNGAVGVHDTIKYSIYFCKWLYGRWKEGHKKPANNEPDISVV